MPNIGNKWNFFQELTFLQMTKFVMDPDSLNQSFQQIMLK
jgi:hypothetical protein